MAVDVIYFKKQARGLGHHNPLGWIKYVANNGKSANTRLVIGIILGIRKAIAHVYSKQLAQVNFLLS